MTLPQPIEAMRKALTGAGYEAWLVGGCVRDALLGGVPHDFDIATNAVPGEIIKIFGEGHCQWYGKAFGTVCVKLQGESAEITTFRTEGDYRDGRHPERVNFAGSVEEDLSRRDFTMNAIAYTPERGYYDPYGGERDLREKVLRCVGVPQRRFEEDALRILRGMRFSARFGLTPEPLTAAAMRAMKGKLKSISAERVYTELCGMLMGKEVYPVLRAFPEIIGEWIPEVLPSVGFTQHSAHHDFTVWEHTIRSVAIAKAELEVRWTMLLHDIGKPAVYTADARGGHFKGHADRGAAMAEKILERLRAPVKMRETVRELVKYHRYVPETMPEVRRIYGALGAENFERYLEVIRADNLSKREGAPEGYERMERARALYQECVERKLCCTPRALAVNGNDLKAAGFEGREIGEALKALLGEVIEERLPNEREALLAFARRWREKELPA